MWHKRRTVLFSQNKSYDEAEWRCWPGSPLQQPIWFSGGVPIRFHSGVILSKIQRAKASWDLRLVETRSKQMIWEVALYNLLPSTLRRIQERTTAAFIDHWHTKTRRLVSTTATIPTHSKKQSKSPRWRTRLLYLWKEFFKTLRDRKYTRRNAEKNAFSTRRNCYVTWYIQTQCEHVNGLCLAGWLNEQSITMRWFQSTRTCPYSWATGRNSTLCKL